jgi:probable rRNA maturation factor
MISFNFISKPVYTVFNFNRSNYKNWIKQIVLSENKKSGTITYIFCNDEYLLSINKQYLNHNYYTDIISFDYSNSNKISGDIFISMDRIYDNAKLLNTNIQEELLRVMSHGLLHFCGYKDKTESEKNTMRFKEEEKIKIFYNCFT